MCTFLNDHISTVLGEPHWWYKGQNACLEWSRSWDRASFGRILWLGDVTMCLILLHFFSVLEININIDWKTSMKYYLNLPNSPQYVNIYYSLVFSVSHKVSVVKTTIIILSYICQGKWKKIDYKTYQWHIY
jgi:hypothetical protein